MRKVKIMAIKLGQDSHKVSTFKAAHPTVTVGSNFFTVKSQKELQDLIDNTYKMLKKLDFQETTLGMAETAKKLIQKASSESKTTVIVKWGIHQSQNRPQGVGRCSHFTIASRPSDWHLYLNTDGKKIAFMSNGPGAANMVAIKRY